MRTPAIVLPSLMLLCMTPFANGDHTRNILLTGYWAPTNEMLRQFSPSKEQNPAGWVGRNWEGRGYDVYAYFPEFPEGPGQGMGDLEVDYQDTAADWARIIEEVRPVAIITFSRDTTSHGWEFEPAHQRFRLPGESHPPGRMISLYSPDYSGVRYPSDVPIAGEPLGRIRRSSLPMEPMAEAIRAQISSEQLEPFVAPFDPKDPGSCDFGGTFLSGYIGYLGVWHRDVNESADATWRCVVAGHIHVGMGVNVLIAAQATEITLRALIEHVTEQVPFCPADFNRDGVSNSQDFFDFIRAFCISDARADFNRDGAVTSQDFFDFFTEFFAGCP